MVEPPAPPPPPAEPPAEPPDGPPASSPEGVAPPAARRIQAANGSELVLLVAGVLFIVATFLPWYRLTLGAGQTRLRFTASDSAWSSGGLGVLAALFGVAAVVVVIAAVTGSKAIGRQTASLLALVFSAIALVMTLLRLAFRPQGSSEFERIARGLVTITRGFGLWLAFAAAIVMTVAAFRRYREDAV